MPPKKSRISPALARIAERGMAVTEDQIRGFVPGETDLLIAEAMLSGALTYKEIANAADLSAARVSQKLKDPLLCAWASRTVHQHIHTRLGMLDAAMYRRALGGCVRAYEALMKRYGKAADIKLNVNVGAENFEHMSNEALDALLARRMMETAIDVPRSPIVPEEAGPGEPGGPVCSEDGGTGREESDPETEGLA